jgi:hypothetical protein
MTAPTYNSNLLYTGLVQLSNVTNTFAGYITSAGAAYNLVTPWQADKLEWYNYTKFGTDTNNLEGVWFRDFPTGDALIVNRGTTTLTSTLETTNGVTVNNTPSQFVPEQQVITGVSTTAAGIPCVITVPSTAGWVSGSTRIIITKLAGAVGSILNNAEYVVNVLSGTTASLYTADGFPVNNLGTYTSGGQATLEGPRLGIVNSQPVYRLTLGTSVMGNTSDVIYFNATKFNSYFNFGTAS